VNWLYVASILVVEASCIKKTFEDLREIGNLCLRKKISIEILNPLTNFDLSFNISYARLDTELKQILPISSRDQYSSVNHKESTTITESPSLHFFIKSNIEN
jgi:hypothetical protein